MATRDRILRSRTPALDRLGDRTDFRRRIFSRSRPRDVVAPKPPDADEDDGEGEGVTEESSTQPPKES